VWISIKAMKSKRAPAPPPPNAPRMTDLRARGRELAIKIKELRVQLKTAKDAIAVDPVVRVALGEIEEHAKARRREERARCGVFWGSYLLIEAAADQANASKMDPSFARSTVDHELAALAGHELWLDEGRVGVQIQGGISVDDLEDDTRIQIHHAPDHRTGRRAGTRRILRMRVGSDGRDPIWAEWPMTMHRPLPAGAKIKAATVSRRQRDCRRWHWVVQIQIDIPEVARRTVGTCALNLGWCQRPDGLRAGYVVGDDGRETEIVVPVSVIDRIEKASSIRSFRDTLLIGEGQTRDREDPELARSIGMRDALVTWLRAATLPDWLRSRCVLDRSGAESWHVAQWRSADRFRRLAAVWRHQRFDGDERGFLIVAWWARRDEHLERYERGLERGARLHRREVYRIAAAKLSARYATLVVDDTDLRQFQRSPRPDEERREIATVKRQQQIVAPSELRLVLASAFGREGRVDKVILANLTCACHGCGVINEWDRLAAERDHTCSGCGLRWDQDANAGRNLLREWVRTVDAREAARVAKLAERKPSRTARFLAKKLQRREAEALET